MVGYGTAYTDVNSIDRRSSDGMLVLSVASDEPDLVGSSDKSDSFMVMSFKTDTDSWGWSKVFVNIDRTVDYENNVYFTPDGSKVLATGIFDD